MSDLQIGLISLGVVLILVVVIFNWWQDRRVRAKMREHFPDEDVDPLLADRPQAQTQAHVQRREPGLGAVPPEPEVQPDDPDEVDHQVEAVLDIAFAQPVDARELSKALQALVKPGGKPLRIFAERDGGGHRAQLRAGEAYVSMQLAVLLANRSGPLSAIEWSQLWTAAQALATKFEGSVEGPEQDDVLQRAAQLDNACAELDVQVGLGLRPQGAVPLADLQRMARDAGFLPHGRALAWMAESGQPRFTLLLNGKAAADAQSASIERLDLLLDLPNSPSDAQAFSRMAGVGRDLAARLGTELLDDQGRPVAADADAVIDQQLAQIYQRLEQTGFLPGDARTARIFS